MALPRELSRTFWKAGIAIAAKRPMITTTIMISTRVNPFLDVFFVHNIIPIVCLF
jgi:hypothetical protein